MQYGALGKAYFEDHKDDAEPAYEGITLVNDALKEIEELKEELAKIKGSRKCPGCGADLKGEPAYCSKCGTKIEYDAPAAEEEAKAEEETEKPADAKGDDFFAE